MSIMSARPHWDNDGDRQNGHDWEGKFCELAAQFEKSFTQQQAGRTGGAQWMQYGIHPLLLPDFAIWTAPGEHHEIKNKAPKQNPKQQRPGLYYGLEQYRLEALVAFRRETQQPVLYTIHDWKKAGAVDSRAPMLNRLEDWLTVDVHVLARYITAHRLPPQPFKTWVNAKPATRPGYFWPVALWQPLVTWWNDDDIPF